MLVMLLNLPNMSPKDAAPDLNWSSILIPSNISIQVWFQDRDFINLLQSPEEFRVAGIDVTVPKLPHVYHRDIETKTFLFYSVCSQ